MKQNNPFVLAGYEGPEYFCDRVAETRSLIRAIEKAGNIAKRLIQSLRPTISYDEASGKPSLSFDITARNPQSTLAQIFDYIKGRERKAVIALDEFQQIGKYPEKGIEATLREFVQFSPVRFIFAGSIETTASSWT